jgi:hypothetical protein
MERLRPGGREHATDQEASKEREDGGSAVHENDQGSSQRGNIAARAVSRHAIAWRGNDRLYSDRALSRRPWHRSFNLLHKPYGSRIKQQAVCPCCDRLVDRSELVKVNKSFH